MNLIDIEALTMEFKVVALGWCGYMAGCELRLNSSTGHGLIRLPNVPLAGHLVSPFTSTESLTCSVAQTRAYLFIGLVFAATTAPKTAL